MVANNKKKPAPSKTKKPGTTYDASTNMWVYSDNPSTWGDSGGSSCGSSGSYDSGSSSSYDSGSSSCDSGGF